MSSNNYATADMFRQSAKMPPRYADAHINGVGRVRLKSIDAAQFARVQNAARSEGSKGLRDSYAMLVAYCLCDKNGDQLFDAADDSKMLNSLDCAISQQLVEVCMAHCGINESDLEELVKNSGTTSTENTDSDSQLSVAG